ncbi:MAG: gliding motility-associated C-terminal domain-containing protein [Saprospiraceae bacterium]|nr:gliding motility-associated C-terminal domain-containing protein [Saprospiraceae bacterium]
MIPCGTAFGQVSNGGPYCPGSSAALNASGATSYQWSGPNGFTSTLQNPVINNVNSTNAGLYIVTVTDGNNCTATLSTTVIVNAAPNVTASSNGPICTGSVLNLISSGGTSYQWSGPNSFTSNLQNPTITNVNTTNAGVYMVTVTNGNNCTATLSTTVIVNAAPNVTASSNSPICTGGILNLMSSGGASYQWTGPNSFTSNLQNPTITNVNTTNAGVYMVTELMNNCTHLSTTVIVNAAANVTASSNSPICTGGILNLMSSGGTSYQWSGPNSFTSNLQNPTITNVNTTNAGVYMVTVTNGNNCTATLSTTVNVNSAPNVTASSNGPICAGSVLNLMTSGGASYQWSGPNGFTSSLQNPVITNVSNQNQGSYIVTVTNANGCTSSSSVLLSINSAPLALLSSNSPVCNGGDISFQLSGGTSYIWQGPNGFVSTLQNPTISNVTSLNSGTYSVTVTGQNSCTTTVSTSVNVTGQLNVAASSNSPVCQGDTIKLTANGGTSYIWSGPNGFNATSQNPVIPLANSNTNGTYILTVSDVSGCTGTRMVNVLIQNKPIVIINGDQQICQGDTVNLTTPSSGSLLWSTGSSATMITASPSVNTLYSLLVEDNGCKDSASFEVIVRPSPNLTLLPTTSTISTGQSVQLNVSGADEYIWTPSFGLTCADCPDPIATPIVTTTYCVEGRIDGCVADTCLLLTVQETCALVFSNVFSPDGDGSNDSWCSLAYDCISNQSLFIYDRWGNLIHSQTGIDVCWDGTKNGTKLQTNVYTYLLQITKTDGLKENRSGSITLVN